MNKKILIAQFCIFLIITLPICFAQTFEQEGETLIIEAKKYEPETLRSDYMEQLNIPVRVILGAIRGAPISVPEIRSVRVELIKQKQAQKENVSLKGTSEDTIKTYIQGQPRFYRAPSPTLDNLGFIQITLKKIPQEHKVPQKIDLDFKATITYEAELAGFTLGGENTKFLKQGTAEMIEEEREKYRILGERYYLRVVNIKDKRATIEILDPNFERKTSVTLDEGDLSRSISLDKEAEPYSIRLKLEEIRGAGIVALNFSDKQGRSFNQGEKIGGGWKLAYYSLGDRKNDPYIRLSHEDFKTKPVLTQEEGYDELSEIKDLVDSCPTSTNCKVYEKSNIEILKDQNYNKEDFQDAIRSLESLGLEKLESVDAEKTKRIAIFETEKGEEYLHEGDQIGDDDCKCKISSITIESVRVKGVRNCYKEARSDTQRFEVGESYDICNDNIELEGITSSQEAVITVLPGTGRGKTTTYFSVHIPVEERAIQHTQEELQAKINRTKATIANLDVTINKLQKLVEGWTKLCLATAAVFTVMSFFQGMRATAKAEEELKEGEQAIPEEEACNSLKFPAGVNTLRIMNIRKDEETKYKTLSKGKYTIKGDLIYDEGDNEVTLTDYKFFDKENNYYKVGECGQLVSIDKYYGNFRSGDGSGRYDISLSSDLNTVVVPVQDCSQIPSGYGRWGDARERCEIAEANRGTALYLVYEKQEDEVWLWHGGEDGKYYKLKNGKNDGDSRITEIDTTTTFGKRIKIEMVEARDAYQRKETNFRFKGEKYNLRTHATSIKEGVECSQVMSPGQCKVLFNACDPVMCPPSRCDFNGRYRIDNVIQSGFIGSILLCLPNIKEGVMMPVCLSGILAALKNLRSILQGYVQCLEEALHNDQSVGLCDRIRSIYICQILWKEAMAMMGLAKGNLFDAAAGRGGGEYLTGIKGGVAQAGRTVDYFTNEYAKSVFAAYRGRSSKEIGAVICEKAIYGKGPILGEIVEDVTKAQNPPQFTAYIEEQPLYSETEHQSMYKLYYHIYAGSETVNYKVFLRKPRRDYACAECSGTIEPDNFIDKSTLFMQEPGYQEVCVIINGRQYCNFGKVVSSSFGANRAHDYLLNYELSKKITTEEQCRSDPRGYVPEAQVEKICSQLNPGVGKGNDIEQQWKKVGTCGKNEEGVPLGDCWIKLGDMEKTNPELYRETLTDLCENEDGNTCQVGEVCDGRKDTTAVRTYQNVVCCYGKCVKDPGYASVKDDLSEFSSEEEIYEEMFWKGVETCEEGSKDPFLSPPLEWGEKVKEIERAKKTSNEYNEFHYFKGLLYLLCKNCERAKEEFNMLDENNDYFKKACGQNTLADGGLMLEYCKETCQGEKDKTKEAGEEDASEEQKEPAFMQIEFYKPDDLNNPVLYGISPQNVWVERDVPEYAWELENGGLYRVKLKFRGALKECKITVGEEEEDVKLPAIKTTSCFSEKAFKLLGDEIKLTFDVTGTSGNKLSKTIIFTNQEQSVQPGKTILCQTPEGNHFCIGNPQERCSDYFYLGDENERAQFVEELSKSLEGCKADTRCASPDQCTPEYNSYTKG